MFLASLDPILSLGDDLLIGHSSSGLGIGFADLDADRADDT